MRDVTLREALKEFNFKEGECAFGANLSINVKF